MDYELALIDFYLKVAPERVGGVSRVLEHFAGREDEMLRAIEGKYGVRFKRDGSFETAGHAKGPDDDGELDEAELAEFWRRNGSFNLYDGEESVPGAAGANRDDVLRAAIAHALENQPAQRWGRAKVMIVGRGAAGKTSTVRSLLGMPPDTAWRSTVGIEMSVTHTADWRKRDQTESIFDMLIAKAAAFAVQFGFPSAPSNGEHEHRPGAGASSEGAGDAAQEGSSARQSGGRSSIRRSSVRLLASLRSMLSRGEGAGAAPASRESSLIGSAASSMRSSGKTNGSSVADSEREAVWKLQRFDSDLVEKELGPEERVVLNLWDYGGQRVFFTLHHLFLTEFGVYVLVFDMRSLVGADSEASEDTLGDLRFWLNAIRMHAAGAPVAIVGTYLDEVDAEEDLDTIDQLLRENLELDSFDVIEDGESGRAFMPLNNNSAAENRAAAIREAIETAALSQDYVQQDVALSWAQFLDSLLTAKGRRYFDVEPEASELAQRYGLGLEELRTLLEFFHQLGMVVFVQATKLLRNRVITDPQWLLDKLTAVIRDRDVHVDPGVRARFADRGLGDDFDELMDSGRASWQLVHEAFGVESYDYLIDFAVNTLLMAPIPAGAGAAAGQPNAYIVPSLLPAISAEQLAGLDEAHSGHRCWFEFEYLPGGLFQRVLCLALQFSSRFVMRSGGEGQSPTCAWASAATLHFGLTKAAIVAEGSSLMFCFAAGEPNVGPVLDLLLSITHHVHHTFMGNSLQWELMVCVPDKPSVGVAVHGLEKVRAGTARELWGFDAALGREVRVEPGALHAYSGFGLAPLGLPRPPSLAHGPWDVYIAHEWAADEAGLRDGHFDAKRLCLALRALGLRVCFDEDQMLFSHVKDAAEDEIDRSTVFLVLGSASLRASLDEATHSPVRAAFRHALSSKPISLVLGAALEPCMLDREAWTGPLAKSLRSLLHPLDLTERPFQVAPLVRALHRARISALV